MEDNKEKIEELENRRRKERFIKRNKDFKK